MGEFQILYDFLTRMPEPKYRKQRALGLVMRGRVIQTSSKQFIVESKKYLETLNKPSKIYIVLLRSPEKRDLWCNCFHSGIHTSRFNLCSHALAVLLTITLYQSVSTLLLMREAELNAFDDLGAQILREKHRIENVLCSACKSRVTLNHVGGLVLLSSPPQQQPEYQCNKCGHKYYSAHKLNKLIEFNREWDGVPLTGNEYWDHVTQKKRVHDILEKDGWKEVDYEHKVHCHNPHTKIPNKHPYWLDVFAARYIDGGRKYVQIGIEINNEKTGGGHGSKITIPKDRNRAQDIWDQFGIKVIAFNLDHMKAADDSDILKEIYQNLGIH